MPTQNNGVTVNNINVNNGLTKTVSGDTVTLGSVGLATIRVGSSAEADFATFDEAIAYAKNNSLGNALEIKFEDGTYTEQIQRFPLV